MKVISREQVEKEGFFLVLAECALLKQSYP